VTVTHDATLPITTSTTITWTYADASGNISTQTQEVLIEDTTGPEADIEILANVEGQCSVESLTAPTATDNCSGTVTVTHDATLPITASTTVTWTYTDASGNTST
ncbi:HYR-like domain-containing protein, partial [Reichenbachiella agariperforans]|uniref:HYR-like domain-containing protein n=1 Tax=Reichenbachiella agariperforans TaxID=156994 RepID=UPI001C0A6601